MKPFNKYFDHTCLKPEATSSDIKKLCAEARKHDFYSVCVNGCYVKLAAGELSDSDVKVAAVIGFPIGSVSPEVKFLETNFCGAIGASVIVMVINVGALKEGRYDYVIDDIAGVVSCADDYDAIVKVIIETCLLTDDEIIKACELSVSAGAEFVKTSTGFAGGGAEARHIELMRRTVGNLAQIKASGGIRSYAACKEMIAAGADRIGASASVQIMEEYLKENL